MFVLNFITVQYSDIGVSFLLISMVVAVFIGQAYLAHKRKTWTIDIRRKGFGTCGLENKFLGGVCCIINVLCVITLIGAIVIDCSYSPYGHGILRIIDGTYCIMHQGEIIRELTLQEYKLLYFFHQELNASFSVLMNALFLGNSKFYEK